MKKYICLSFDGMLNVSLQDQLAASFHSCLSSCFGGGLYDLLGPIPRGPSHVEFHHRMDRESHGNLPVRARDLGGVFLPQLGGQPNSVQPDVDTLSGNVQGGHVPPAASHHAKEALSQRHAGDAAQHLK